MRKLVVVSGITLCFSIVSGISHGVEILQAHNSVEIIAFSKNDKIAAGCVNGTIRFWDLHSIDTSKTLRRHTGRVGSVVFSPNGEYLVSGGWDGDVHLWDGNTGVYIEKFAHFTDRRVYGTAFSSDGKILAVATTNDAIWIFDFINDRWLRTLTGHRDDVLRVAFKPNSRILLSVGSPDGQLRFWNVDTGDNLHATDGPVGVSYGLAFSPDGRTFAVGTTSDIIEIWDSDTYNRLKTLRGHTDDADGVAFSPDRLTLASASDDSAIRLWDINTGDHLKTLNDHTSSVRSVAFSQDGLTLASGSYDNTVRLWDLTITPPDAWVGTWSTHTIDGLSPDNIDEWIFHRDGTWSLKTQVSFSVEVIDVETSADVTIGEGEVEVTDVSVDVTIDANEPYIEIMGTYSLTDTHFTISVINGFSEGMEIAGTWEAKDDMLTLNATTTIDGDTETGITVLKRVVATPLLGDINRDGVVNIQDLVLAARRLGQRGQNDADMNGDGVVNIQDLVLVAGAFGNTGAAPAFHPQPLTTLTAADVQNWLTEAEQMGLRTPAHLRGIAVLEQLLSALTPKETTLLPNYPNPFNPETWIPYHLANASDVSIIIYDVRGAVVRRLALGYQQAGYYTNRSRAAYWDGANEIGETVASGVYFYTLTTDKFTATRQMLILK